MKADHNKPNKPTPHKANGPYYPIGLLAGEYCKTCRLPWPCPDASSEQPNEDSIQKG